MPYGAAQIAIERSGTSARKRWARHNAQCRSLAPSMLRQRNSKAPGRIGSENRPKTFVGQGVDYQVVEPHSGRPDSGGRVCQARCRLREQRCHRDCPEHAREHAAHETRGNGGEFRGASGALPGRGGTMAVKSGSSSGAPVSAGGFRTLADFARLASRRAMANTAVAPYHLENHAPDGEIK